MHLICNTSSSSVPRVCSEPASGLLLLTLLILFGPKIMGAIVPGLRVSTGACHRQFRSHQAVPHGPVRSFQYKFRNQFHHSLVTSPSTAAKLPTSVHLKMWGIFTAYQAHRIITRDHHSRRALPRSGHGNSALRVRPAR